MKKFLHGSIHFLTILTFILALIAILGLYISPQSFIFAAFCAISFPIIYIAAIVFTVLQLTINKKKFFICGALTLGLTVFVPRYFQVSPFPEKAPEDALKIMSYNVRLFNLYDWRNNINTRNQIFNFLEEEAPDVVCFQEFYHQENSTSFATKDTLLQFMPWKYVHEKYTHEMRNSQYFGVATFSKFPIVNRGEIPFINDDNNFCIYSDVLKNQDTIRIFNAHIGSIRFKKEDYQFFGDNDRLHPQDELGQNIVGRLKEAFVKRAAQIEAIYDEIKKSPYEVVVCLDMNDTPMSYAYQTLNSLVLDAFRESGRGTGATYIGEIPSFRIDYIFHSKKLKSFEFTTHVEELSDHRAISCKIMQP